MYRIVKALQKLFFLLIPIFLIAVRSYSQQDTLISLKGKVTDDAGQPVIGAHIASQYSSAFIFSDENGSFNIELKPGNQELVISTGEFDTIRKSIDPSDAEELNISLNKSKDIGEVTIIKRKKSTEINLFNPIKTENIGMKELAKAACCNLSESFETTPSVDAGFTDAVSGYKQISMLGLSGPNVAFTRENIPDIRGLASIAGLTFTPGPWVESIQLSKGAGSVVNGYEGVAGQINVELMKPGKENPDLLLNAYQSGQGRTEGNLVINKIFSDNLNTSFFGHVKTNWMKVDQNNDGYLDQPLGTTYLLGNRWVYLSEKGLELQLGVKGTYMNLWGGQKGFDKEEVAHTGKPWGFMNDNKRIDVWSKIGKVYIDNPTKSMGLQLNASLHDQSAQYGLRKYEGRQHSFYANYIYQNIIGTTDHLIKFGASFQLDRYQESFSESPYERTESVPGVFTEYTYNLLDKLTVVAGLRGDYNNIYGFFATPRLHMRYAPDQQTSIRASIGRAQRTVNVFAENMGFMASKRIFLLPSPTGDKAYGLDPEIAWNMGINATRKFILNYRDGSVSADYYFTHFQNMVITDIERYNSIKFYNLDGRSFAHSFQIQLDYEAIRNLDVRVAYRWYDVQTTYADRGLLQKPLLAQHRFFVNAAYTTRNNWAFDITGNWTGSKRMVEHVPDHVTHSIASGYTTPDFWIFNAQVSKSWNEEQWKIYVGAENLLGVMQHNLIIHGDQPYREGFDAGLVWGSGMGRNIYIGMNYRMKS